MQTLQHLKNNMTLFIVCVLCTGNILHGMQQDSSSSQDKAKKHTICLAKNIPEKDLPYNIDKIFRLSQTYRNNPKKMLNKFTEQHSDDNKIIHVCLYCSSTFKEKSGLKQHERNHTGEKPYTCSYCSRKFAHFPSLQHHERVHTGEKPYKCQYCEYATATPGNLSRHIHRHKHTCPYDGCSYAAVRKGDLDRHIRTHKYICPYLGCNYESANQVDLKNHKRRTHYEQ